MDDWVLKDLDTGQYHFDWGYEVEIDPDTLSERIANATIKVNGELFEVENFEIYKLVRVDDATAEY